MTIQELKKKVLLTHSKSDWENLAQNIYTYPDQIELLIELFCNSEIRLQQKTSYIISKISDLEPCILQKHYPKLIDTIVTNPYIHDSSTRCILRLAQFIDLRSLDEGTKGILLDYCFKITHNSKMPVAIKVYGITILGKFTLIYPEIISEVKPLLLDLSKHGSQGERARANSILKTQMLHL